MLARILIAALALPLISAAPLSAQLLSSQIINSAVRPAASAPAANARVTDDPYAPAKRRKGHIGGIALRDNVDVGLGVYKVRRDPHIEPDLRKLRPMEDNPGRHKRMAAVQLNVRF